MTDIISRITLFVEYNKKIWQLFMNLTNIIIEFIYNFEKIITEIEEKIYLIHSQNISIYLKTLSTFTIVESCV